MIVEKFGNSEWMIDFFKDEDVYIVASGPSMKGFDFGLLKDKRKVVISHASLFCKPNPDDIMCLLDSRPKIKLSEYWGDLYGAPFKVVCGPIPKLDPIGQVAVVPVIRDTHRLHPKTGLFGPNSTGHLGISIALVGGAKHIYLLGHDCGGKEDEENNFYNTLETKGYKTGHIKRYEGMARGYNLFEPFREKITNLSLISNVKNFETMDWRDHFAS